MEAGLLAIGFFKIKTADGPSGWEKILSVWCFDLIQRPSAVDATSTANQHPAMLYSLWLG